MKPTPHIFLRGEIIARRGQLWKQAAHAEGFCGSGDGTMQPGSLQTGQPSGGAHDMKSLFCTSLHTGMIAVTDLAALEVQVLFSALP